LKYLSISGTRPIAAQGGIHGYGGDLMIIDGTGLLGVRNDIAMIAQWASIGPLP